MTHAPKDLAALLGSRICHDLISPIGAIGNGLELISMSGIGQSPELSLISESVSNANARIRFYRIAFGAGGENGQSLSRQEIVSLLDGITRGTRLKIAWEPPGEVRRLDGKLVFLLIQCCESAMPYGGSITVSQAGGAWRIEGVAPKLRALDDMWPLLTEEHSTADITPALVQFGLVRPALIDAGRSIRLQIRPDRIVMEV